MATPSIGSHASRANLDKLGDEFPILCETCLGENPFVRMTKQNFGKACKICERPFTVYRWKPGPQARYKKTELCLTCAKLKNVCQTCVLDLQFGLPVQVRDSHLQDHEKPTAMPLSDVNREYMVEQHEKMIHTFNATGQAGGEYGKILTGSASAGVERLARKTPYYRRNLPHVCSFFAKGSCTRGSLCPYRHEMPVTGEMANQNIVDRYHGKNDPVAKKILERMNANATKFNKPSGPLPVPEDVTVTTLWVGGVTNTMTETDIRNVFGPHGPISSVRMVGPKNCAFVTYLRRDSAEAAANALYADCEVDGHQLRIAWGRRQTNAPSGPPGAAGAVPPPPGVVNRNAAKFLQVPGVAPPPGKAAPAGLAPIHYPSQDPQNMAAKFDVH